MSSVVRWRDRLRPGRGGQLVASVLALALSGTLLAPAVAAPLSAGADSGKKRPSSVATEAADVASARIAARLTGRRIEALSERTETSTTWVNANGSLTTEVSAGPIRYKEGGTWHPVDLNLVENKDGSVEPKGHPEGLRLAAGGGSVASSLKAARAASARDLVILGEGDQQITLRWKGGLPEPQLKNNTATYADALPGADVVVQATRTGFEQFVNINQRPAESGYPTSCRWRRKGSRSSNAMTDRCCSPETAAVSRQSCRRRSCGTQPWTRCRVSTPTRLR